MIKIIFLASIVLLGSAVTNLPQDSFLGAHNDSFITIPGGSLPEPVPQAVNGTQNFTFVTLPSSLPESFVEVNNGSNATMFTPVSFVETEIGQVTGTAITRDLYACQSGYNYLTYNDEVNNRQNVCNRIVYWGIYRLQGGGSADGQGYSCRSRDSDTRSLGSAVCVRTSVNSRMKGTSEDCPSGWDRAQNHELSADKTGWCNLLNSWDIARVGVRDSMDGPGYGCTIRDWDDRGLGHVLCIKRNLDDIQTPDTNEDICGSGRSLLTVKEAMANRQAYCNTLPYWGIARLAGGASMDGAGYGCKVRARDDRSLGHAVCGSLTR